MSEPQTSPTPSPEDAFARFEAQLEPDLTAVAETPEPEPEPTPEPESDPAPAAAASAETPKVDRRTREGKLLSIQQQIDSETARRYTAKQEADAEESRLATLRAERARLETPAPKAPVASPPPVASQEWKRYAAMPDAPNVAEFTGENAWQEYQYAVGMFIADKRIDERFNQREQQQHATTSQAAFRDRVQAEITKDPSFQEKLSQTPVDTRMWPYLQRHAQGADIMVYLANHREDAQRIAALNLDPRAELPSASQIEAIGEIVGSLKSRTTAARSGPASSPSPISQAKPLIKPVSGAPQASDDDDGDDEDALSTDEFIRRGNKRDHRSMPRLARR